MESLNYDGEAGCAGDVQQPLLLSQVDTHGAKQALLFHFLLTWGILKQSYVGCSCTNVPLGEEEIKRGSQRIWGECGGLMPLFLSQSFLSSFLLLSPSVCHFPPQLLSNGLVSVTTAASVYLGGILENGCDSLFVCTCA